eukprot:7800259-Ditylum_brightwellii.AAC.1
MEKDYSAPKREMIMNFFQLLCASGSTPNTENIASVNLYDPTLQTVKHRDVNDANLSIDLLIDMFLDSQVKFAKKSILEFF